MRGPKARPGMFLPLDMLMSAILSIPVPFYSLVMLWGAVGMRGTVCCSRHVASSSLSDKYPNIFIRFCFWDDLR